MTFTTISKPIPLISGAEKVKGLTIYTADFALSGMIWGKVLRSPLPHGRIIRINTTRAKALPGILAVLTAQDIPGTLTGRCLQDMPVLARDRVRFVGEKVAAVAAENPDIAEEALSLIDVEYEELPGVFDPLAAMREDAPILHDQLATYRGLPRPVPQIPNCHSHVRWGLGNTEKGFREAAYVFEHTFTTPMVHQGYIEPPAAVVTVDPTGQVQVWSNNKAPFLLRTQLANVLGLPESQIKINLLPIGGDFGGKGAAMDVPLCYYLAKMTGRPVKMGMTNSDDLLAGNPRHASIIRLKTGITKGKTICFREAHAVFNSGAYGAMKPSPIVNLPGAAMAGGCYRIPHVKIDAFSIYTNAVPCGYYRAPGEPQMIFAVESQMDMLAAELGIDSYEFRLRNGLWEKDEIVSRRHHQHPQTQPGTMGLENSNISIRGEPVENVGFREILERAALASHWKKPKRKFVGRGMAATHRHAGLGNSCVELQLNHSGQVSLVVSVPDTGTGSHTIFQQIVAETLGLSLDDVAVMVGLTDTMTKDSGVGASRVTHITGQAILQACENFKDEILKCGAITLGCQRKKVTWSNGRVVGSERALSLAELASRTSSRGKSICVQAEYQKFETSKTRAFLVQVAEVEVDPETGKVTLLRLVTAHDSGTILNPLAHQGQIEGAVIQGLGYGLVEELVCEEGRVKTLHLGDYKLPSVKDVPELVTVLSEDREGPLPFQGKSIGESSISPVAASIANAVFDAIGVRIVNLPITAEKVHLALKKSQQSVSRLE